MSSRDKNAFQGTNRSGEGAGEPTYVTPALSYDHEGVREKNEGRSLIHGKRKKKKREEEEEQQQEGNDIRVHTMAAALAVFSNAMAFVS